LLETLDRRHGRTNGRIEILKPVMDSPGSGLSNGTVKIFVAAAVPPQNGDKKSKI